MSLETYMYGITFMLLILMSLTALFLYQLEITNNDKHLVSQYEIDNMQLAKFGRLSNGSCYNYEVLSYDYDPNKDEVVYYCVPVIKR